MSESLTWSTATLQPIPGEEPIKLKYCDSHPGRSAAESYTTIIALHGLASNAVVWNYAGPMFAKSFRFLAHNRRGYEGSSAHYEGSPKDAVGRYAMDLVGFVRYAVEELGVPAKGKEGKGGIVLLGWSKGCAAPMCLTSLLASPTSPPFSLPHGLDLQPYLTILSTHLRHIILFEPPGETIGLPYTPDYAAVISDRTKPFLQAFAEWLIPTVPEENRARLGGAVDTDNALEDFKVWLSEREDEEGCAQVAEVGLKHVPKDIGFGLLYCEGTIQWCRETGAWIAKRLGDQPNTLVRTIPGGNHFFNASDPETFVPAVEKLIQELDAKVHG